MATFIIATTVEALSHNAVLGNPDTFADDSPEAFVDETTRLVLRYLVD